MISDVDTAMKIFIYNYSIIPTKIVSGKARGVDTLGELWAERMNIPVDEYPANWDKHKRAAGPIRNSLMADNAEALVAVWDNKSRGTKNMIDTATKKGLLVYVFVPDRFKEN